jgi:DNA-binding response OmpR family regulator
MNVRVLLVDDEELFISALAERLGMRGIDADWASSGSEALKKVKDKEYDLALLDVKMPQIGGIDLKRQMQEIDPSMHFIFFTGHGSKEDFEVGSAEAACYLIKPLRIEKIMDKIHEVLGEENRDDCR